MKAMTIGISPYYNYPGTLEKWNTNNTEYASNHGGSLITRAIMKEFNADYVNDFSDIATLKNKYDTCIMALATHVHEARDVSMYVKLLKKLNMKVVVVSLGVSDYLNNNQLNIKIHSSIKALLNLAQESSNWIGVRGPYTAHILSKNGFKNVVPIGCPTVFWNMKPEIVINTKKEYNNPLVVYQENIAKDGFELIKQFNLLGQDFKDEVIFTDNLQNDISLRDFQRTFYQNLENPQEVLQYITSKGIFQKNFDEWFETIKKHDFIFGPRLHGVIASLIQGIPAVLTTRDLRTKELAEFFNIPSIEHGLLHNTQFSDIVKLANFQKFELTYQQRYKNYLSFIAENRLDTNLEVVKNTGFIYTIKDQETTNQLNSMNISENFFEKDIVDNLINIIMDNNLKSFSIWGLNALSINFLERINSMNIKINFFIDTNLSKCEQTFFGQTVYTIEDAIKMNETDIVIISEKGSEKMIEYASKVLDIQKINFYKHDIIYPISDEKN